MKTGCLRTLGIAAAIALVAGGITVIIGLRLGWQTPREYSDGLFWAAMILAGLGLMSVLGGYGMHTNPTLRTSETAGEMTLSRRSKRWISDLEQDWQILILMALSGAVLFGMSILVDSLAGAGP